MSSLGALPKDYNIEKGLGSFLNPQAHIKERAHNENKV